MGYEHRMRGSKFRRPATKKKTSKEDRGERETSGFYRERATVDPAQVSSRILNALGHLGRQRFVLPPFSEHFERWMKDVRATLSEFETELPEVADQPYREVVDRVLSGVQEALGKGNAAEKENSGAMSKIQQELASCELELSNLERDYKLRAHEARRGYEQSARKLKGEIESLDKRRLRLLRKGPSIVERILHRSRTKLDESTSALQLKRVGLGSKETALKRDLDSLRQDYAIKRKQLAETQESLKAKLAEFKENKMNDALEARELACEELRRAVTDGMDRLSKRSTAQTSENIQ
jgi:hypothetical protein